MRTFHNLVLGGGGPWAVAFIGALEYLEHTGLLSDVKQIVSCSAGALIGFLLCLGMSAVDIRRFLLDRFRKNRCHCLDVEQVFDVVEKWGLDDGNRIMGCLQDALQLFMDRRDVTFLDFAKLSGKDLVVCASNVTTGAHEFMCMARTPQLSVITALRMSMAVPFLFTPVLHEGCVYLDGGLFNNYPVDYCCRGPGTVKDTLGFNLNFEGLVAARAAALRRKHESKDSEYNNDNNDKDVKNGNQEYSVGDDTGVAAFASYIWQVMTMMLFRSNAVSRLSQHHQKSLTEEEKRAQPCGSPASPCNVFTVDMDPQYDLLLKQQQQNSKPSSNGTDVNDAQTQMFMNFSLETMEFGLSDAFVDACARYGYTCTREALSSTLSVPACSADRPTVEVLDGPVAGKGPDLGIVLSVDHEDSREAVDLNA
jgi:predicted acylesterase/phospholipase RssA